MAIDVSDRLGGALLPFGVLVVGLSLVLLTMVFRSVAVPLKATIGYLLSVGAAFGVTAMVFEYGWFSEIFNVGQTAPVISFLPILMMGILFGLAMDYEVFLVSRIREEYVHGGDAHRAIEDGFAASARVVVAAAVIMFAVFAAFVPDGEGPIKTIAFGLAVGVFIDAFVVRMTLVPAVLALLGRRGLVAAALDRPAAAVVRRRGRGAGPPAGPGRLAGAGRHARGYAEDVPIGASARSPWPYARGEVAVVDGPDPDATAAARPCPAGWPSPVAGSRSRGLVLPEQAAAVRRRTAYLDCAATPDVAASWPPSSGPRRRSSSSTMPTCCPHATFDGLARRLDDLVVGSTDRPWSSASATRLG